jgi:hypothetical protein
MNNKKLYIETSVISYLTAKPSRDIVIAAYQQITRDWWIHEIGNYTCFISDFVIDEISQGDPIAASLRIKAVDGFVKLGLNPTVKNLVNEYQKVLSIPPHARLDLFHLAISVGNGMEYVLSWNFKHIANAFVREKLQEINFSLNLRTPTICTPEELIGGNHG